jgi:hypothetical protein
MRAPLGPNNGEPGLYIEFVKSSCLMASWR